MTTSDETDMKPWVLALRSRTATVIALLAVELLVVIAVYQVFVSLECRLTDIESACRGLRSSVVRAMAVLAAAIFIYRLRPGDFASIVAKIERGSRPRVWLGLNLAGFLLVLAPIVIYGPTQIGAVFGQVFWFLALGGAMTGIGALFWATAPRDWWGWLRGDAITLLPLLAAAALIPDLARQLEWAWYLSSLGTVTYWAVQGVLIVLGQDVVTELDIFVIGIPDFYVQVGAPCSGIEGFALVVAFISIYAVSLRGHVHQKRLWLVVLPVALVASWLFNVARIAALILIGAYISPEHAVNGFHSFAGWLFFTLLVFVMLAVMEHIPWLRSDGRRRAEAQPLRRDWLAASILPLAVFLFSGVVVSALWAEPELGYPLRALAVLAAALYFRPALQRIEWGWDPVAILAGVAVGAGWIVLAKVEGPGDSTLAATLAGFGKGAFVIWGLIRVYTTFLLVPLVEEVFFRGYLLARLDTGGRGSRILAVVVSTALFALFHGSWLAAGLAGLVFAWVYLQRGRVADAIIAHMVANLLVAMWAVTTGQWYVI